MIALIPQNCCRMASVMPIIKGSRRDFLKIVLSPLEFFDVALYMASNSFLAATGPLIALRILAALSFLSMKKSQRGLSGILASIAIKIADGMLITKNMGRHVSFWRNQWRKRL